MASFSSLSPIAESATVELSSRAKIRTAFCALIKKRRSKTVSTGAKSPSSFQVLRVRRFVLNDGDEAGSWQGIEEEPHCASNFDTAAINEGDVEVSLDSRYSSKEVLCGPVWDSQSSPDGQDTGRKHLISRIKRICRLRSTLDIGDDTSIEEPHAPWQPGSKSSGGPLSPTLSAGATLLKRVSSIIKREECLRAEEILGIDKRSMLKRLTDPHAHRSSALRIAPANLEQVTSFVNPNDVEYTPNPVIFSHLRGLRSRFPPLTQIPETEVSELQALGHEYYEMDATESEFNRWRSEPMRMVRGIPHRWEKTLATDRMFFDAEAELISGRKRRSLSSEKSELEPTRSERSHKRRGSHLSNSSQGRERSEGVNFTSHGAGSGQPGERLLVIDATNPKQSTVSIPATPLPSFQTRNLPDQDRAWQPNTGKYPDVPPTDWSKVEVAFVSRLATVHFQQDKYFRKFCHPPKSPDNFTLREGLIFDGEWTVPQSPVQLPSASRDSSSTRSSIRSFGSSVQHVSARSSNGSFTSLETKASRSATSVVATSTAITASVDEPSHACENCGKTFRTAGQRRTHINRKHNLRYKCAFCTSAFGLNKDLERHQCTVHKDVFQSEIRLVCPNQPCATPGKEYNRRDNFNRHKKRCLRKASQCA